LTFGFFETPNTTFDYDLFVLLTPGLTMQTFEYDGYDYTFQFGGFSQITDLNYLNLVYSRYGDNWKDTQGNWLPVYGWLTGELGTTNLQTWVQITGPQPVPEPGTLLMLGGCLAVNPENIACYRWRELCRSLVEKFYTMSALFT
jgi:hypothetical protein